MNTLLLCDYRRVKTASKIQRKNEAATTAELDNELYSLDGRIFKTQNIPVILCISHIVLLSKE